MKAITRYFLKPRRLLIFRLMSYYWRNNMGYQPDLSSLRWLWYHIIFCYYICTRILSLTMQANGSVEIVDKNGSNTFGWISPEGIVAKRIGQHVEIFCTINSTTAEATNYTISNLKFYEDENLLDSHNVTKVNETTISFYLSNRNESEHLYRCFLNGNETRNLTSALSTIRVSGEKENGFNHSGVDQEHGIQSIRKSVHEFQILIGSVRVVVEKKSMNIMNLRCFSSIRTDIINCCWNVEPNNFVETNYTIQTVQILRELNMRLTKPYYFTSKNITIQHSWLNSEKIDYCNITVKGMNIFGESQQTFTYNKFKNTVFDIPHLLGASETPTNIMILCETTLGYIGYGPVNLTFEVCFRNYNEPNWTCSLYFDKKVYPAEKFSSEYNITGLTSNTMYELRIRVKLSEAPQYEEYWSDYANTFYNTKSFLPETDIGLFQILHTSIESIRIVHILWISEKCFGSNLRTDIFQVDERSNLINATDVENLNSKDDLPWIGNKFKINLSAYRFVRRCVNYEGEDMNKSVIISVPNRKEEVESCALFYVVQYANNSYKYIWQLPEEQSDIINYTLFWYKHTAVDIIFSYMNWTYLSINQSRIPFNFGPSMSNGSTHFQNEWKFYVSLNTKNSSSGLRRSMELVSSISDFWKNPRFLESEQKHRKGHDSKQMNIYEKSHLKPRINIGWRMSENQFYGWMHKLHGVEEPVKCRGRKNIIRVRDHLQ